ncbi:MAG: hypothetical protein LBK63_08765 [Treponema sp.]|jgi:hypothetical protein|nr:hypothetical protein [Treponema sp.]
MNSTNSEGVYAGAVGAFLRILRALPKELALQMPLLSDIALLGGGAGGTVLPSPGLIQRRLDRRYARICVVYRELSKLDFTKARSGTGLEDMVFAQTDFDRYKKISREDFAVFFDEGLEDFEDSFYKYNLMMDRETVQKILSRRYKREGDYYCCDGENPLLPGIMRTLHTALDFAPLFSAGEILGEGAFLIRFLQSRSAMGEDALSALQENLDKLFSSLIKSLDRATATHPDGMTTTLFVQEGSDPPILCGTFYPEHKAHTIRLTRPV